MTGLQLRRRPPGDGSALGDLPPLLRRVYAARGIHTRAALDLRLGRLLPPTALGGLDAACELLQRARDLQWRVVVVGDFDCDGATGTAVAVRGLRLLGLRDLHYRVPNRFLHGYGLSPALVQELLPLAPRLILTVDNGVAAHAGIAAARAAGIEVLVTDHHLPGESLPPASAMVNPNAVAPERCEHAAPVCAGCGEALRQSRAMAGVGVVFYLLLALRARLRAGGAFAPGGEPDLSCLLDLVALGTVADLVPLEFNNRVLVEAGLRRIRAGQACAGVAALVEVSQRRAATLTAADLGFALAPRINAAGRLEDMGLGIECLLTEEAGRARALAGRLHEINAERRDLQAAMVEQGEALVQQVLRRQGEAALPWGLVLYEPGWHAGVVGLVASRLKERLHRPVIAFAPAGEDAAHELKGSARSIPGFHLRDALAAVDARHPGLILRFGGHAMAAGLSLAAADLSRFAAAFDAVVAAQLAPELREPVLWTDGGLSGEEFDAELARALRYGGPWGQACPEPLFDDVFEVDSWRPMGEVHLRLMLRHAERREPLEAVMFGAYDGTPPPRRVRAAYHLQLDEWNGRERLRLLLRHLEPL